MPYIISIYFSVNAIIWGLGMISYPELAKDARLVDVNNLSLTRVKEFRRRMLLDMP
jgi:hypothetical protein